MFASPTALPRITVGAEVFGDDLSAYSEIHSKRSSALPRTFRSEVRYKSKGPEQESEDFLWKNGKELDRKEPQPRQATGPGPGDAGQKNGRSHLLREKTW